jgi:hypothetical protein
MDIVIKTYKGKPNSLQHDFKRDAQRMMSRGYGIESQSVIPGRRGCAKSLFYLCLLGIPFLFDRPKDTMMVTYRLRPVT